MAKRILVAVVAPKKLSANQYALWNPADAGVNTTLSNGDLTVTGGAVVNGVYTTVRADVGMGRGLYYWETTMVHTGAHLQSAGVATINVPLDSGPLGSYSPPAGETDASCPTPLGGLYHNGTVEITDIQYLSGKIVRHLWDGDTGQYSFAIGGGDTLNILGTAFATYFVGTAYSGFPVYPAGCVAGTDTNITANFGATNFVYDVPYGARPGVYTNTIDDVVLYLSSTVFDSGIHDTSVSDDLPTIVAYTPFTACIVGDQDVEVSREGSCWPQGGQSQSSRGQLVLVFADGVNDDWVNYLWRDAPVILLEGYEGDNLSSFEVWATSTVESFSHDDDRMTLVLSDELAKLDTPIQTNMYPVDAANTNIANAPKPLCLGRPLYCEGVLTDTSEVDSEKWSYDLHDDFISSIAQIYDQGDIFIPVTDWNYHNAATNGSRGFQLVNKPVGRVVSNPVGALYNYIGIFDASPTDGDFTTWVSLHPNGWTFSGGSGNSITDASPGIEIVAGAITPSEIVYATSALNHVLMRVDITITAISASTLLDLGTDIDGYILSLGGLVPGTYSYLMQTSVGAAHFKLAAEDGGGGGDVTITKLRVYAVEIAEYLPEWMRYLLVQRKGLDISKLDTTAIDALHAKTSTVSSLPYRLAYFAKDPVTYLQLLRDTLDCYCGYVFTNRVGQISVGRFERPAIVADIYLDTSNIIGMPIQSQDDAAGLTTVMQGGKNNSVHTDSDIVTTATTAFRAILKSDYTITRAALPSAISDAVSQQFSHAVSATPFKTLIQDSDAVQAEISRVSSLWRSPAGYWTVSCILDRDTANLAEPGITVNLKYPRFSLAQGRNMLAKKVVNRFFSNVVDFILWDPEESSRATYVPLTLTGTLSSCNQGDTYSSTLAIAGGLLPYSNLIVFSGALPTEFTISITGSVVTVSGVPYASTGTFNAVLQLQDASGAVAQLAVSMTVTAISKTFLTNTAGAYLTATDGITFLTKD